VKCWDGKDVSGEAKRWERLIVSAERKGDGNLPLEVDAVGDRLKLVDDGEDLRWARGMLRTLCLDNRCVRLLAPVLDRDRWHLVRLELREDQSLEGREGEGNGGTLAERLEDGGESLLCIDLLERFDESEEGTRVYAPLLGQEGLIVVLDEAGCRWVVHGSGKRTQGEKELLGR